MTGDEWAKVEQLFEYRPKHRARRQLDDCTHRSPLSKAWEWVQTTPRAFWAGCAACRDHIAVSRRHAA